MLFVENEVDFYKKVVDETIHKTAKRLIVNDTHRGIAFHQKEYTGKGVLIVKIIDIIPLLDKNTSIGRSHELRFRKIYSRTRKRLCDCT